MGIVMAKHWMKGGTAITNFDIENKWIYTKAIAKYGDRNLYISYDIIRPCSNDKYMCLHSRVRPTDLSRFWRIYDRIKKEEKPVEENYIKFKPEDFRKAYKKGCSDVKEVLKNLIPDFDFEPEKKFPKLMKGESGSLYLFMDKSTSYCIKIVDGGSSSIGERYDKFEHSKHFTDIKGIEEIE